MIMSQIDEIVEMELARMKRDTPFDSEDYWLGVKHGLQCGVVMSYGLSIEQIRRHLEIVTTNAPIHSHSA